jgi:protein tyrosine phosphatase
MFSSIFEGISPRRNTATTASPTSGGTTSGSSGASGVSLDAVVADIVTAHTPHGPLALSAASQFLEEKLRNVSSKNNRLRTEFAALEALQAKRYNIDFDYTVAAAATEIELNRYVDVLPYEHTRVKVIPYNASSNGTSTSIEYSSSSPGNSFRSLLRRKSSSSKMQFIKEQLATYINASNITCSLNGPNTTTTTSWRYIAAQGPLPTTCGTFWEMIVQEKVHSIVMLTDIIENKRNKCHQYFALEPNTTLRITPRLQVYTRSAQQVTPGLVLRKLEVIRDGSVENDYVCDHYHYTGWPDHGVPESAAPLCLLSYMLRTGSGGGGGGGGGNSVNNDVNNSSERPIVVHCSAGIGRSGVFCVVDSALRRLIGAATATGEVDVATSVALTAQKAVNVGEIVAELRKQRAGMVQTTEQFVFCHTALLELTRVATANLSSSQLPVQPQQQ